MAEYFFLNFFMIRQNAASKRDLKAVMDELCSEPLEGAYMLPFPSLVIDEEEAPEEEEEVPSLSER